MSKFGRPPHGGIFDLAKLASELRAGDTYVRDGHAAHTLSREDDLRVVVIAMKAGARLAEHQASRTAMVQGLRGHVQLRLPEETVDIRAGQAIVLEGGLAHDVEAILDSAFLLTIGWGGGAK